MKSILAGRLMACVVAVVLVSGGAEAATYYVNAARPDDSGDGLTWATAKKTIQAAVDLAVDGDTVLVTNGVYAIGERVTPGYASSNRVVITNNITVRSVNGPEMTVIAGRWINSTNGVRGAYMSAGVLMGFTVSNGYAIMTGDYVYERSGGGVLIIGGSGVITNCVITQNQARQSGGGVYGGRIFQSLVTTNTAFSGGGIANGTVVNCVVSNNVASKGGGVNNCLVTGSVLAENGTASSSASGGGALGGVLRNCVVIRNSSGAGGGVYDSEVYASVISGNYATIMGGGAQGGHLSNCVIHANETGNQGGGASGARVVLCVVRQNYADYAGGGMHASVGEYCVITENRAKSYGGGAHFGTIWNSYVSNNWARDFGGGLYKATALNCLIVSNEVESKGGGGAYDCAITNCTIVLNRAPAKGGVWYGTLHNSIVWGNTATDSANWADCVMTYSCSEPRAPGTGNSNNDPQFLSEAAGNYRLAEPSPCINAGTNAAWMAGARDLDGEPRIFTGDGRGIVDMGCYEHVPEPAVALIALLTLFASGSRMTSTRQNVQTYSRPEDAWL